MSGLLPTFIYPADSSSGQSYYYDYDDIVNVSWSWDGPPGASVIVRTWLSNSGNQTLYDKLNVSIPSPGDGFHLSPLNFDDVQYPPLGHFNLLARFQNGTIVSGPNSGDMVVANTDATAVHCWNCSNGASSSITSVSPTGTITLKSATTSDTTSGSLITSQPTPSQPTPVQPTSPGGALRGGQIAGIVVGVIIAVAIAGILVAFYQRKRLGGKTFHQMATTEGCQKSPQNAFLGSPQELHGHHQKTEHGGTELYEMYDSG